MTELKCLEENFEDDASMIGSQMEIIVSGVTIVLSIIASNYIFCCFCSFIYDLPINGTRQTPALEYKRKAGNN